MISSQKEREPKVKPVTPKFSNLDFWYMSLAIDEAERAFSIGEVPVGAVMVDSENRVLASTHNLKEVNNDPCGHAEILAIRDAAKKIGSWRLNNCRIYVTLEPCLMCMGALIQSRIGSLVFGAYDPKGGAISNGFNVHQNKLLNHRFSIVGGVEHYQCGKTLSNFFKQRRSFYKK